MAKIENDKYYTPIALANYCWDKTFEIIGKENISEIVEPSCGDGAFYHHDKYFPDFGYDIEPQCNYENIIKGDYLTQDIKYLSGRLVIGNPPYGARLNMAQKFYKKSVKISDYIAFILPASQLGNTHSMYEYDLIHSEDLGFHFYTGRKLHCCFNIYKRPENGELNKKVIPNLKDITIYRKNSKGYEEKEFDIRICYWGKMAGKILKDGEHYAGEYKIKINNESKKKEIVEFLSVFNWKEYLNCIAMINIQQFHIIDVLKENIDGIS